MLDSATSIPVPEYLFEYLEERAVENDGKDVVLHFLDGSLQFDLLEGFPYLTST